MTTKIEVNKAIRSVHPKLRMIQANGYCYFYSNDDQIGLYLAGIPSTSVSVCYWSDFSIPRWIEESKEIMEKYDSKQDYSKFEPFDKDGIFFSFQQKK